MKNLIVFAFCAFTSFHCSRCPMITRASWGARPSLRKVPRLSLPVSHVFIHHTAGQQCHNSQQCKARTKQVQIYCQSRKGFNDIAFNFLIGGDGSVYEGVGWRKIGVHSRGMNRRSIGISFHGNFSTKSPSKVMLRAAKDLIHCGVKNGYISENYRIHGGRDNSCSRTASPGDSLYGIIKTWHKFGGRVHGLC